MGVRDAAMMVALLDTGAGADLATRIAHLDAADRALDQGLFAVFAPQELNRLIGVYEPKAPAYLSEAERMSWARALAGRRAPAYTASIDAALSVAPEGVSLSIVRVGDLWFCSIYPTDGSPSVDAAAHIGACAIISATLRWRSRA